MAGNATCRDGNAANPEAVTSVGISIPGHPEVTQACLVLLWES